MWIRGMEGRQEEGKILWIGIDMDKGDGGRSGDVVDRYSGMDKGG
jgi:hypothetical protein